MDAYWITGDGEHAHLRRKTPPEILTREQSEELLTELGREGEFDRVYPGWPTWLEYECQPNDDRRIKFAFADVITSLGGEQGVSNLVSESAAAKLEPYLRGQAEFHPAKIKSTPEPYYLLWVKQVVDALDYERSVLRSVEYLAVDGVVPLRIAQAAFKQDKIAGRLLFRLTPGRLTRLSLEDYATDDFVDLVKRLKISGVHFYRNNAEKPLVPVKISTRGKR
jgi:hypothetical protein